VTILYFDCFSGASGDMILGALVDAGAPDGEIRAALEKLPIERVGFERARVARGGIEAASIVIDIPDAATHRTYRDVVGIIRAADLTPAVRDRALETFRILAVAEGKIHGVAPDDVHFHEVGALDTIADVVGTAIAIEYFSPTTVVASAIPMGSGTVQSAHGMIPVPAPAVTEILAGVPLVPGGEGEVITPTGAAILKAACDRFGEPPPMTLRATGYGAGTREQKLPNVVRVMVGDAIESEAVAVALLETNIDDMSPELIPHVIEVLLREGAVDAWSTPIIMKKGRPALTLTALVEASSQERVLDAIYRETTTFGVRMTPVAKDELAREWMEVRIEGNPIRVKIARRGGEVVTVSPEYEDAAKVARATGAPLKDVYERARREAMQTLTL
jgi:uncharacterized protein (TIGR00299 family) protein